ncbi:MAG: transglutaminase domain-containing protein [Candidatus Bathyarchaeia archaeon]
MRVLVGEVYENGSWRMADESDALKYSGEIIEQMVTRYLSATSVSFQIIPLINLSGFIPSINNPLVLNFYGDMSVNYYADKMIFFTDGYVGEGYRVTYMNYLLDESALRSANPIFDYRCLSVLESLLWPLRIVEEHGAETPYKRLKAIERYLRENYRYDMDYNNSPPEGYDPVLWFLFEEKRGMCIHFNSALVLLARSIGIPVRLVAGFLIKPNLKYQVVYINQFHAYAEAPFEGFRWIIFDATGRGGEGEEADVGYVSTVTEILYLDRLALKARFSGLRVSGLTTEIYLKRSKTDSFEESILVGRGLVENGVFNIDCVVPLYIDVGDYYVVARTLGNQKYRGSESDPQIKVASSTYLSAKAPEKTIAGRSFTVSGDLREVKSNIPIVNESVAVVIGSKVYAATTDSYGRFSINCLIEEPGNYTILVSFYGTEYYLPSSVERSIRVLGLEITSLTKNPLIRGEAARICGWMHADDLPGDNELVIVYLNGVRLGETITDSDGYFSLVFHMPVDYKLGLSELGYFLPSSKYSVVQMVRVMARTRVAALSPETVEAGKPFNITATLLDDL